jgi:hypothetical protein
MRQRALGWSGVFRPDLEYLWRYPKISGVQHRSDKPDSGRIFSATFQKNPKKSGHQLDVGQDESVNIWSHLSTTDTIRLFRRMPNSLILQNTTEFSEFY